MAVNIDPSAQMLIDRHNQASSVLGNLGDELRDHYEHTGMLHHQPGKANFLIERGQRSAAWAAMWHVVTSQTIRTTLPKLKQGESIMPTDSQSGQGQYHAFMDAGGTLLEQASAVVFDNRSGNDWRRYQPLWREVVNRQEAYRNRWEDWKKELEDAGATQPPTPPVEPGSKEDIDAIWRGSGWEIAKSALWALVNKRRDDPEASKLSPRELTQRALQSATVMNWATTMKRSVNLDLFPNLFEDVPDELDDSFFAPKVGQVFKGGGAHSLCTWTHPSLSSGPWRYPGGCAGRIWLQPSLETDRNNAEELFTIGEAYAGAEIPRIGEGTYNGGLAILTLGAFIAEQTIYSTACTNK